MNENLLVTFGFFKRYKYLNNYLIQGVSNSKKGNYILFLKSTNTQDL